MRARERRREYKRWSGVFESVGWFVEIGGDLPGSWEQGLAYRGLSMEKIVDFDSYFKDLAERVSIPEVRIWLEQISLQYRGGGELAPTLFAAAKILNQRWEGEVDAYCNHLRERVNLWLLLLCLPPVFVLIFTPLLAVFQSALNLP